jgi:hypothetical protein
LTAVLVAIFKQIQRLLEEYSLLEVVALVWDFELESCGVSTQDAIANIAKTNARGIICEREV